MDYCTVEYGGNDSENSNIYCQEASPAIQNCTMRYSDGYAMSFGANDLDVNHHVFGRMWLMCAIGG